MKEIHRPRVLSEEQFDVAAVRVFPAVFHNAHRDYNLLTTRSPVAISTCTYHHLYNSQLTMAL